MFTGEQGRGRRSSTQSVGVNDAVCVQAAADVDKRAWHDKSRLLRVLYERKGSEHWRAKIEENKGMI